jgi:hypothetical protein
MFQGDVGVFRGKVVTYRVFHETCRCLDVPVKP